MESFDVLILAVEASIALAGFAGIIATFQFSGEKEIRRGNAVGLGLILESSLMATFTCSVAIVLFSFDIKEATVWATTSVVAAAVQILGMYHGQQNSKGVERTRSVGRLSAMLYIPGLCLILLHALNVSDIFFHREAGPIIASIVYALGVASYMFSRLLLQPIWRNVRLQEAAKLADTTSGQVNNIR